MRPLTVTPVDSGSTLANSTVHGASVTQSGGISSGLGNFVDGEGHDISTVTPEGHIVCYVTVGKYIYIANFSYYLN